MNITVAGGGNIGTQFAVHCAEKGHRVTIYGSRPDEFQRQLFIVNELDNIIHSGEIACATKDEKQAFAKADMIFVTMPAYCLDEIGQKIEPYANSRMKIGLIPGTGGGECALRGCLNRGAIIFGLQRVPSVARLKEYGRSVRATGYRDRLYVASLPGDCAGECSSLISQLLDIPCEAMPDYLNLTLTPSNPILHTTRLRCLFEDYEDGITYDRVPLFYEEWTDKTSELLLACDDEIQEICRKLKMFNLSYVHSLREHYESKNAEELTKKITSIKGFKGLKSPVLERRGRYIPDLNSRYFTADFPYGLAILIQIADLVGVPAHNMKETYNWYNRISQNKKQFYYTAYGINSLEDFINFYQL